MTQPSHHPRVTILMPVYNGEKHLGPAIESILRQTYGDFVCLIIDDGSSDSSSSIALSFDDPRIRVERNPRNLGLVKTLNRGLDMVGTEFVARMDSDDIALPDRIERQIAYLDNNPGVGLCGTAYEIFCEAVHQIITPPCEHESIIYGLLDDNAFLHSSVVARMDILNRHGLRYSESYKHAEDYDLWVRLARHTHVGILPQVLVRYRSHPENVSNTNKSEQIATRDRIRLDHLETFDLSATANERELHLELFALSFVGGEERLIESRTWLESLAAAISTKCDIPLSRIHRDFSRLWYSACGRSADQGFKALSIYLDSPIARQGSKDYVLKLFFRCLMRRPIPGAVE